MKETNYPFFLIYYKQLKIQRLFIYTLKLWKIYFAQLNK